MLPARCVRILGSTEVWWDGAQVPLGGGRARALVAALALRPGGVVSRGGLAESVWGADAAGAQAGRLDVQVSRLRRALRDAGADPQLIQTTGPGYRLAVAAEAVDAFAAEAGLALARERLAAGDAHAALAAAREARDLWRGPSLLDLPDDVEAVRLEELRRGVEEEISEARLALGEAATLIAELEAAAAREPLRERLHGQLMRALHAAGREAEALAVYDRLRARLVLDTRDGRLLEQAAPASDTANVGTGLALLALGSAWAAGDNGTVTQLDLGAGRVRHTFPLGPFISAMAAGRGDIWVAFYDANYLVRIQPATHTTVRVPLDATPQSRGPAAGANGLAYGAGAFWVARVGGDVERLDPVSGRITAHIRVPGANPVAFAAGHVWVANKETGVISRIDPRTNTVTARVSVPTEACCLATAPDGIFVSSYARGLVSRITRAGRVRHRPGGLHGRTSTRGDPTAPL
jgi:DNA-binding SARP family transcriptional activator